uniref:Uncharacterized protein n=1 Tax=Siphoviridae sp. ctCUc43 TaxID=2825379 RepID=A0A8S5QIS2_9CAUD|nr:MAG TPA: hypothetical protein [Siphoviridae sp. ctCUc43]
MTQDSINLSTPLYFLHKNNTPYNEEKEVLL